MAPFLLYYDKSGIIKINQCYKINFTIALETSLLGELSCFGRSFILGYCLPMYQPLEEVYLLIKSLYCI